jgi:hypothetical protein
LDFAGGERTKISRKGAKPQRGIAAKRLKKLKNEEKIQHRDRKAA